MRLERTAFNGWRAGVWLLAALTPSALNAQTLNPTTVQFTASTDHNSTAPDGVTPLVSSYELEFYQVGAAQPFQTLSLGKPTPDASNTITVNFANLLSAALPSPGIVYDATVSAIGPGGTSASAASNAFEYQLPCSNAVSPTTASFGSSGGAASLTVTAPSGCGWTATSNASWLTIASGTSGSGSGTVNYTAAANPLIAPQTGTLTVAGQTVTVTQAAAACNYTVSPTSASPGSAGGAASVSVTAQSGCAWTAASNAAWITITSGASGGGNGTTNYTVAANTLTSSRTGTLTVAGQTVTVTQGAAACNYTVSPTSASLGSGGGAASVTVTAQSGCAWTATSNASWLTITSGASGSGSGAVNYTAAADTSTAPQTGTLTVAGQTIAVTEMGTTCSYSVSPTSASIGNKGGTGNVVVTTAAGCSWTSTSGDSWLTITSGGSGDGAGTVSYSAAANTSKSAQVGLLTVAGITVTITEAGPKPTPPGHLRIVK